MTEKLNLWDLNKSLEVDSSKMHYDIKTFRSIGGFNGKLASWDPLERSSRYYKSILFEFSKYLDIKIRNSKYFFNKEASVGDGLDHFLGNIDKRGLGAPVEINFYDKNIDIDYLLACDEMFFLYPQLKDVDNIVEIGAGFGRLPHSIIQNFNNIKKYYIIDLEWMLEISSNFLREVLTDEQYTKLEFINTTDYESLSKDKQKLKDMGIDLTINIDSFQEMQTDTAKDYLKFIEENSKMFYSKNAICKYDPETVDINLDNKSQYLAALDMGLCKEVINIFNTDEVSKQQNKYLNSFRPKGFKLEKDEQCYGQFLYYHSALYVKA